MGKNLSSYFSTRHFDSVIASVCGSCSVVLAMEKKYRTWGFFWVLFSLNCIFISFYSLKVGGISTKKEKVFFVLSSILIKNSRSRKKKIILSFRLIVFLHYLYVVPP